MKTVGNKQRQGERSRALCDRCGTLWDRRLLSMDGEGMLVCPQEGHGRDGATLTRGNAAAARAAADRQRPQRRDPGVYQKEPPVPIVSVTGNFLFEDGTPMLFEDDTYMALES